MRLPAARPRPGRRAGWRAELAGLRALAVTVVVLGHAGVPVLAGGFVGVDVFFVLSGYLITGLLLDAAGTAAGIRIIAFYARRARRILPAAVLVLAVTVAISAVATDLLQASTVQADAPWAALFAANVRFGQLGTDYLHAGAAPSPLQHYWSLAVEEQFYVIVPALVAVAARAGRSRGRLVVGTLLGVISAGSFAYSVALTRALPQAAYFSPFARAFELSAGGVLAAAGPALALVAGRHPRAAARWAGGCATAGLGMIAVAAVSFGPDTEFPGPWALLPVAGSLAVIVAGCLAPGGRALAPLRHPWVQGLGAVSFSLYLWHWPVLVLAAQVNGAPTSPLTRAGLVLLSLLLAVATYHLVELPAQRVRILLRRPALTLATAVVLVGLAAAVPTAMAGETAEDTPAPPTAPSVLLAPPRAEAVTGGSTAAGTPQPSSAVGDAVRAGLLLGPLPPLRVPLLRVGTDRPVAYTDGCHVRIAGSSSPLCTYGDTRASRTMVLYGDSHATQWLPALISIGTHQHWRVILVTKSGCPLPAIPSPLYYRGRAYPACDAFHDDATAKIRALHPDLLVLSDYFPGLHGIPTGTAADHVWSAGLRATLGRLAPLAGRVAYLQDIPTPRADPVACLAAHLHDISACRTTTASGLHQDDGLRTSIRAAVLTAGTRYVDTSPWFCTAQACPAVIDATSVYFDATHMSATYSRDLAAALAQALDTGSG